MSGATTLWATIDGWLPDQVANGSHGHWATANKKRQTASRMVWAECRRQWGVPTMVTPFPFVRAKLTVTFVFPQHRRRDTDNLYSRAKGVIDGLKSFWIVDDDTDHLEVVVTATVEHGRKATVLELADCSDNGA